MEKLPTEMIENILCRLPIERALRAKQVCTTWRILLRSKTDKVGLLFSESYYPKEKNRLYYGDEFDPVGGKMNYNYSSYYKLNKMLKGKKIVGYRYTHCMLGSCNGLVCFERAYMEKPFLICNPITGEVVYAPRLDKSIAQDCDPCKISGFGYCHSTNEYKIGRMHYQGLRSHVLVYTIGSGGWRNKGSVHISPSDIAAPCISPSDPAAGVYANGAVHWLYRKNINKQNEYWLYRKNLNKQNKDYAIMAFHLEDEKFKFMDLSDFQNVRYDHSLKLLGGKNLYLVHSQPYCTYIMAYKRENTNTTNACDLKGNYNDQNSWHWIKEYSIESEDPFWKDLRVIEPLAVTRNNEFILRYGCRFIYCYDLKTLTLHKLVDGLDVGCNMINLIPHANSTVSILSLKKEKGQDRR